MSKVLSSKGKSSALPCLNSVLSAIPSACVWAVGYMIPGILLGAISLELPPSLAFEFLAVVIVTIAIFVGLTWLVHFCSRHFAKKIDKAAKNLWESLSQGKKQHWLIRLLTDPRHPENHRQLILLVYAVITAVLFLVLAVNVFAHGSLTSLNESIANLLRSIRTDCVENVMLAFTILGSKYVMLVSATLILLWFCVKKYWRITVHWLATIVLVSGTVEVIKKLFYSSRPGFLLHGPVTSSFPSGHTCLTVAFVGVLSMFVAQNLKPKGRRVLYIAATLMVFLVGFSRLYLTAHWLTDVVSSVLLGITLVLIVTISYRRGDIRQVAIKQYTAVIVGVFVVVWLALGLYVFKVEKHNYTLYWPTYTISMQAWQQRTTKEIPLYRPSRFGHPLEAFNVEWVGKLKNIQVNLREQGWKSYRSWYRD